MNDIIIKVLYMQCAAGQKAQERVKEGLHRISVERDADIGHVPLFSVSLQNSLIWNKVISLKIYDTCHNFIPEVRRAGHSK